MYSPILCSEILTKLQTVKSSIIIRVKLKISIMQRLCLGLYNTIHTIRMKFQLLSLQIWRFQTNITLSHYHVMSIRRYIGLMMIIITTNNIATVSFWTVRETNNWCSIINNQSSIFNKQWQYLLKPWHSVSPHTRLYTIQHVQWY